MHISEIESQRQVCLPKSYIEFLAKEPAAEYCFNEYKDEDPDFEGRCWEFLDEVSLSENIEMSRVGEAPAHKQLELYLRFYREFSGSDFVASPEGELPINRVANGFVIAEDNGDILYLDPNDAYSVWIYHLDGSDVKKVSHSFEKWLEEATIA